jgi:hypothetical protein
MNFVRAGLILLAAAWMLVHGPLGQSPQTVVSGPRMPYVDWGACPFEGCTYREWVARRATIVRTARRRDAPVAFNLNPGDRATALTGVVVIHEPGIAEFSKEATLVNMTRSRTPQEIHVKPGDRLYLLTYHGEGETVAWFNGRIFDHLDASTVINGVCEVKPDRCAGRVVKKPVCDWWVQLQRKDGAKGWTADTDAFANKDRFGDHD